MVTTIGPLGGSSVPDVIQFPQPARRLERRRIVNDTSI
jgi:hypothetical protein